MISYEKMDVFAVIEIVNVVLKCVIVFCLVWFSNRLIAYGGLLFIVSALIALMYVVYCFSKLEGFSYANRYHKQIVKEMTIFATKEAQTVSTNQIIQYVLFGVAALSAIGIVVVLLVKPKQKAEAPDDSSAK